jgi:hypothetical protein
MATAEAIYLFCPLARHLSGMHPTHSLDAVVDSLRASELLECRCRPDLNADRSPTEAAVVTKCQDPARRALVCSTWPCTQDTGSAAQRVTALWGRPWWLVVLRPRRGPWEVELGDRNGLNPIAHATGLNKNPRFLLQRQDPQITVSPSERRGWPGTRHFARWKQIGR